MANQRVVPREQGQFAMAKPIGTRVSQVGERCGIVEEDGGCQCCSHPFILGPAAAKAIDRAVGLYDCLYDCPLHGYIGSAPSEAGDIRLEGGEDAIRGHAACYFARAVAAHPVGEHRQALIEIDAYGIFIVATHLADVRSRCEFQAVLRHDPENCEANSEHYR